MQLPAALLDDKRSTEVLQETYMRPSLKAFRRPLSNNIGGMSDKLVGAFG